MGRAQMDTPSASDDDLGTTINGRYELVSLLGAGGMGKVYRANDTSTGKPVALKRLQKQEEHLRTMFQQEYQTLESLAHPGIIQVFDYGVDEAGPYYTMELLAGEDMVANKAVSWQEICGLLRDVASALAILQSRRLVHRDVNPRNILRTNNGRAKLIDFGAMTRRGVATTVVGTPGFIPPEAIYQQPLDGRSDLYSLGAVAYWALSGKSPYPGRRVNELRSGWLTKPVSLSKLRKNLPPELESLIMAMLSVQAEGRPSTAAEVSEKLATIADLPTEQGMGVRQAYLSHPRLVGQSQAISRAKKKLLKTRRGRGGSILVDAVAGAGRSRLLDEFTMEAKLLGLTVARADSKDAGLEFGIIRALGHNLEAQDDSISSCPMPDAASPTPEQHTLLTNWWLQLIATRQLALVVDDLHRIDARSAAFLAVLARAAKGRQLCLATSLETGGQATSEAAVRLLRQVSTTITLTPLTLTDTFELVQSIFGEVPNAALLADRLHAASDGIPRTIMDLAQHLIDTDCVRYEDGSWLLPDRLSDTDMPGSAKDVIAAQASRLSTDARLLGTAFALRPDVEFSLEEQKTLTAIDDGSRVFKSWNELVAVGALRWGHQGRAFSQLAWIECLRDSVAPELARSLHDRLAVVLSERNNESDSLRCPTHLLATGRTADAIDQAVQLATRQLELQADKATSAEAIAIFMSDEYLNNLQATRGHCDEHDRSVRDRCLLELALVRAATRAGELVLVQEHLPEVLQRLKSDSGLTDYESMGDGGNCFAALTAAQSRHDERDEKQRGFAPIEALMQLSSMMLEVGALATSKCERSLMDSLPSLVPMFPLSPALSIAELGLVAQRHVGAGRYWLALDITRQMQARLSAPDHAGLDPTMYRYARFGAAYAVGLIEAPWGIATALDGASVLDDDAFYQISAERLRTTYHLTLGNEAEAHARRRRAELLQIQHSPTHEHDADVIPRLNAAAHSDDWLGVKRTLEPLTELAARYPGWHPILLYAEGHYERIRGEFRLALERFEQALELTQPGVHPLWSNFAAAHLQVLVGMGRSAEAVTIGKARLQNCQDADLFIQVALPLALAEAATANFDAAVAHVEMYIDAYQPRGMRGRPLGNAYEVRARIAILQKDPVSFRRYAELCSEQYGVGRNTPLTSMYQRLLLEADRQSIRPPTAGDSQGEPSDWAPEVTIRFSGNDSAGRCKEALDRVLQHCGSDCGYLILLYNDKPKLAASASSAMIPMDLLEQARDFVEAKLDEELEGTMTVDVEAHPEMEVWLGAHGVEHHPILLTHLAQDEERLIGLALVRSGTNALRPARPRFLHAVAQALLDSDDATSTAFAAGTRANTT
ncbi:MAG: protein kinase [Polyangiaceae bacterium]|nr:protein kinase [Polyangiaceae bacterium]